MHINAKASAKGKRVQVGYTGADMAICACEKLS